MRYRRDNHASPMSGVRHMKTIWYLNDRIYVCDYILNSLKNYLFLKRKLVGQETRVICNNIERIMVWRTFQSPVFLLRICWFVVFGSALCIKNCFRKIRCWIQKDTFPNWKGYKIQIPCKDPVLIFQIICGQSSSKTKLYTLFSKYLHTHTHTYQTIIYTFNGKISFP